MKLSDGFRCPECHNTLSLNGVNLDCSLKHGPYFVDSKNIYNFLRRENTYFEGHWQIQSKVPVKKKVAESFLQLYYKPSRMSA